MRPRAGAVLGAAALVGVVAAVVAGLVVLGPPSEERARRLDGRRLTDLQRITTSVDLYWTRHGELPGSLEQLSAQPGVTITVTDPASTEPYEYARADSVGYDLCARFELASEAIYGDPSRDRWAHGPGRHCFRLEARRITPDER